MNKTRINDLDIIKYLSIIFNPNNYPLNKEKLLQITEGIFKEEQLCEEVFGVFCFSDEDYYIEQNSILSPAILDKAIKNTLELWSKYSYVFVFSAKYNSSEEGNVFNQVIQKYKKSLHKEKLKEYFKTAILNIKTENYLREKSRLDLESIDKGDFRDVWRFYNYYSPYEYNRCLAKLFSSIKILDYFSWGEFVEFLPRKFLKLIYNADDYFSRGSSSSFLKAVASDSSDYLISLALINTIQKINGKRTRISLKPIFNIIEELEEERQFYWLGLLISNIEYNLNKDLRDDFYKKAKQMLKDKLLNLPVHDNALDELIKGLRHTSRDCHLCCLSIFNEIKVLNKDLAIKMAKEVLNDYDKKISCEDNHNLCMCSEKEVEYCNAVIQSIIFLNNEAQVDINKTLNQWLKDVLISKDTFNYSASLRIQTQDKALHLFMVVFCVLESIQKNNSSTIKVQFINEIINAYLDYLNDFSYYSNNQIWLSVENIFKWKIMEDFIDVQLQKEYNSTTPNFKLLAHLLSLSKKKNKQIKEFIYSYFKKYHLYWDMHKIEDWLFIWQKLQDREKLELCISKFPDCRQRELAKFYQLKTSTLP